MISRVIKTIFFLLAAIPPVVALTVLVSEVIVWKNATIEEGRVVSCRAYEKTVYYDGSPRSITQYAQVIKTKQGVSFKSNFSTSSLSSCESKVGEYVKVLKSDNQEYRVYTFTGFFLSPLLGVLVVTIVYGLLFMFILSFRKKAMIKKDC